VNKALKRYNVLVTRPAHQASTLCGLIEQQGWQAIRFPTLEIVAVDNRRIRQQLETINDWDWLIFISTNAVNFALATNNGKIDAFKACSIAAVGKATEKALISAGLTVDLTPENNFNTEGLLATEAMQQLNDQNCLIVRGVGGRETLAHRLCERGATVDYMEVYSRELPVVDQSNVEVMLKSKALDIITITSGDALKNLVIMIGTELAEDLFSVPLIVISNRIKQLAEESGFKTIAVTDNPSDTAIIKTVVQMSMNKLKTN
jgi:uroporphyrinogen-III synthase